MKCLPTMSARFAPYLHYFLSHWPTDDHGEAHPSALGGHSIHQWRESGVHVHRLCECAP